MSRKLTWAVLLLPAVVLPGGCLAVGEPVADGIPVRRLPAEVLGQSKADLHPVPLDLLRRNQPDVYRVDSGDVLTVFAEDVLGVRDQIPITPNPTPGAPVPAAQGYPVKIQGDGTIIIPEVPPIPVRGMSIPEIRAAIVKAITVDKKLIVPGKERVSVDLLQKRRYRVLVVREDGVGPACEAAACDDAKKPTGYSLMLEAYQNDLLEALTRTGGLPGPCARNEVIIRRGPHGDPAHAFVRIPLRLCPTDMVLFTEADIILGDGDTVYVPAREGETFSVVGGPGCGQYPLPRDTDLRIIEALAKTTCPTRRCGPATVIRAIGCERQVPIRVDLDEALRDPRENILILPGDVIVLPGCGQKADCTKHDAGCHISCWHAKRFRLPGWFSPIGPKPWKVADGDCTVCP